MSSRNITKGLKRLWRDHGNDICTYFGTVSLVSAAVMSAFGTIKAVRKCDELTEEKGEPLTKQEIIKNTYVYFIPTIATVGIGSLCVLTANAKSNRKNAALATACALSESRFRHFKDEVTEKIGKKKTAEIEAESRRKEVAESKAIQVVEPVSSEHLTKCFDYRMGRYFWSDIATIERAMIDFNKQLIREDSLTLADFYDLLNLPRAEDAYYLGWTAEDIMNNQIEIDFSSCIDQTKTPCLVIDFTIDPHALSYGR